MPAIARSSVATYVWFLQGGYYSSVFSARMHFRAKLQSKYVQCQNRFQGRILYYTILNKLMDFARGPAKLARKVPAINEATPPSFHNALNCIPLCFMITELSKFSPQSQFRRRAWQLPAWVHS